MAFPFHLRPSHPTPACWPQEMTSAPSSPRNSAVWRALPLLPAGPGCRLICLPTLPPGFRRDVFPVADQGQPVHLGSEGPWISLHHLATLLPIPLFSISISPLWLFPLCGQTQLVAPVFLGKRKITTHPPPFVLRHPLHPHFSNFSEG